MRDTMNKDLYISTYQGNTLLIKENLLGEFNNNILKYSNENDEFIIDLQKNEFIKENLESILRINKRRCELTLKELNKSMEIPLKKYDFQAFDNKIIIIYELESQEEELKIEINIGEINNG